MEAVISQPPRESGRIEMDRGIGTRTIQGNSRERVIWSLFLQWVFITTPHWDTYHLTSNQVPFLLQCLLNLPVSLFYFHSTHNFLMLHTLCILRIPYLPFSLKAPKSLPHYTEPNDLIFY